MIFDCHVHFPSTGLGLTWEWAACTPDAPAAVAYLKRCGVDGIVANSVRAQLARTAEEVAAGNDEMAEAARQYPGFVIPACLINTNFPQESLAEIRRCHATLGMVWLGELCGYVSGYAYDTGGFSAALQLATRLNMVVQIHNDSVEDMARLCAQFPQTTFLLAHLGDAPEEVAARIELAARFPNLYLDISGHGYQRMGVLELAVRRATSDRVLFGSDYTINDPAGVIARIQATDFDAETKAKLLGGNLLRLLRQHGWKDK
jgi:uncharacterized protein